MGTRKEKFKVSSVATLTSTCKAGGSDVEKPFDRASSPSRTRKQPYSTFPSGRHP